MQLSAQVESTMTHAARCRPNWACHQQPCRPSGPRSSPACHQAQQLPLGASHGRVLLPPSRVLQVSSPDFPQSRDQLLALRDAAQAPGPLLSPSQHRNGKSWDSSNPGESQLVHTTNTRRIKLCSDWRQLKGVVDTHGPYFNHINTAAALVQLSTLSDRPQQPPPHSRSRYEAWSAYAGYEELLQQLLQMCAACITNMGARQVANCMWATARLSTNYTGGHPMAAAVLQQLMDTQARYLLPWSNAQELGNSIWAVAVCGASPSDDWLCQFLGATETVLDTSQATAQDLATIMWALSVLGIAPDEQWLTACVRRAQEVQSQMSHRDAAQVLAAAARLQVNLATLAPDLVRSLQKRIISVDAHPAASPRQQQQRHRAADVMAVPELEQDRWPASLSQGLWGLACVSAVPPTAWMQQALNMMESRLSEFQPHELSVCLWSAATLGQPLPASLVRAVYAATLAEHHPSAEHAAAEQAGVSQIKMLPGFGPQSLAEMIWAISLADGSSSRTTTASRPLAPPAHWTRGFMDEVASQLAHFNEQSISMTLVALARLNITPSPEWVSQVLTHVTTHLPDPSPQTLSNCMWAIAKMGYRLNQDGADALEARLHASLLSTPLPHTQGDSSEEQPNKGWNSQELSNALYAFGSWRHRPSDALLQLLLAHLRSLYQHAVAPGHGQALAPPVVKTQELSNTIWALSVLGVQPSDGWLTAFMSAAAHNLRMFNAKDISQMVYALAKLDRQPPGAAAPSAHDVMDNLMQQGSAAATQQSDGQYKVKRKRGAKASAAAAAGAPAGPPRTAYVSSLPRGVFLEDGIPESAPAHAATTTTTITAVTTSLPQGAARAGQVAAGHSPASSAPPPGPSWFAAVLAEAAAMLNKFKGQDLANLCWGLVQLGVQPGQHWCARLAEELQSRANMLSGPHVALCIWALGKFGYQPAPQSLIRLEEILFRRMPTLAPRELAACISGFSAMQYMPHVEWLEQFADHCMQLSPQFSQQDWSVVVWSLSSIVESDPSKDMFLEDLFLSPHLVSQVHEFAPRNVAILTYSCSMLGAKSPKLVRKLLAIATEHMASFSATDLSAVIMACARMQAVPDAAFFNAWTHQMRLRLEQTEVAMRAASPDVTPTPPASSNRHGFGSKAALPSLVTSLPQSNDASVEPAAAQPADEQQTEQAGVQPLPGSVLAVSAYCLATLKLRPTPAWLEVFNRVLHHHVHNKQLSPRELTMTVFALHMWKLPIDAALQASLKQLATYHKPVYTSREWQTVRVSMKGIAQASSEAGHKPLRQRKVKP